MYAPVVVKYAKGGYVCPIRLCMVQVAMYFSGSYVCPDGWGVVGVGLRGHNCLMCGEGNYKVSGGCKFLLPAGQADFSLITDGTRRAGVSRVIDRTLQCA